MQTLQNHIDGRWQATASADLQPLVNPATGEVEALVPAGGADDVHAAVDAAATAATRWAHLALTERVDGLHRWADAIESSVDELAELEQREMGKPVGIGRTFIHGAVAGLRAAADLALTYPFEEKIEGPGGAQTLVVRQPLGVVGVITPWNFPVTMLIGAVGPLLAAGNTVVVKPSERSPLSSVRLLELCPLPAGVVNLVLGDHRAGEPLIAHEGVRLVHFTGSVSTGEHVGETSGRLLRRTVLELGGKDPVIVDSDADPVATAQAVAFGAFVNTGQICTSMERIYVHRDIAEPFIAALTEAAKSYAVGGDPEAPNTLGPLVDRRQRDIVDRHVRDAIGRGATVHTGGAVPDGPGFYYPPTVLTDVDDSMLVMSEETFGPLAPVVVVDSFDDAVRRASSSTFGLAATIYTHNPEHVAAAARIPAGVVWVNQWQGGGPERLYEPANRSGLGATGSVAAYDGATRPMSIHIAPTA